MEGKTAEFSKSEMMHVIQPRDLNGSGRLFGGALLQMIDELAGIVAKRHCQTANVTTAAIDNLNFIREILQWRSGLTLISRIQRE